jgi:hypothetical protein
MAVNVNPDIMLGCNSGCHGVDQGLARSWSSRVPGRTLTRRTARSGTTLFGDPPSIRAGLILRPGPTAACSRIARSAAATIAFRPSSGLRPAWAERPRTVKAKLPLPGRAPARLISQGPGSGQRGAHPQARSQSGQLNRATRLLVRSITTLGRALAAGLPRLPPEQRVTVIPPRPASATPDRSVMPGPAS